MCLPATSPPTTPSPTCCSDRPVTFYQGLGNFNRDASVWGAGLFVQDEWRLSSKLTMNYGLRYERINPFTEAEDRLNGFVPGQQSQVRPDAPTGLLFPGDPGVGEGIAHSFNAWMPRVGFTFDPTGDGRWSVRASYGIYFDQFQNGSGHGLAGGDQRAVADPVRAVQRRRAQLPESVPRSPRHPARHVRPAVDRLRDGRQRQAALRAALEPERAALAVEPLSGRSALRRRQGHAPAAQRRGQSGGVRPRRDRPERRSPPRSTPTARPMAAPATSRPSPC